MRRLLLVEDDLSLGETLKERLAREGYDVIWKETLQAAEEATRERAFDLIVLDVNLPDGSGFDFARKVRRDQQPGSGEPTPFIFVTAMNSAEHRLLGYEIGAEEFIPKPFHLKELLLRVKHVMENHAPVHELKINGRLIDLEARTVSTAEGEKEFLQSRDFDLLKLLITSAPQVMSRDEILNRIWGEDKFPSHRTVDNAIVRLRQAIGDSSGNSIRSVRGVGYQWLGPSKQ